MVYRTVTSLIRLCRGEARKSASVVNRPQRAWLACGPAFALTLALVATAAIAASPYKRPPAIGGPTPGIARPGPAYKMPKPPPMTMPRPMPSPSITTPRAVYGPDCRSTCAMQCQRIACGGLNVSQCLSVRQRCRLSCNSSC